MPFTILVKQAVQNAMDFARDALGVERTAGLQLEEVESANVGDADVWLITLSMFVAPLPGEPPVPPGGSLAAMFGPPRPRTYKTFTVRKDTGEVVSMKIREVANA